MTRWKLVPVEATGEQVEAAMATPGMSAIDAVVHTQAARGYPLSADAFPGGVSPLHQAYTAMLSAAPAPDAVVEMVARALCEQQCRIALFDTQPGVMEAVIASEVGAAWPAFVGPARAAIAALLGEQG